jgi:hypothetical protein
MNIENVSVCIQSFKPDIHLDPIHRNSFYFTLPGSPREYMGR